GTVGGAAVALTAAGDLLRGRAVGLLLQGLAAPLVEASPACRLLGGFQTVEEVSGGMVLRVGGAAALDLLTAGMAEEHRTPASGDPAGHDEGIRPGPAGAIAPLPQQVVFIALADASPHGEGRDRWVVRRVRGIDPGRRGVMVGHDVAPGARLAFAVRDAAA